MAHTAQTIIFSVFFAALIGAQPAFSNENSGKMTASPKENQAAVTSDAAVATKAEKPIRTGIAGNFLSGRFARENKDLKQAAKYINASLAKDPNNVRLRGEALRLNLLAGNMDVAANLARKLAADGENDPLIASLQMLDAVKAGDYANAQKWVESAPNTGLYGLIKPVITQWVVIGAGDNKAPANLQTAIDKAGFFAPFLNYHSALMYDVLGNTAEAEKAYQKSNTTGANATYRVVQAFANFYARNGKPDQAQQLFDEYAKANPHSTLVPDKFSAGNIPAPLVGNAREGLAEAYYTTASLLFGDDSAQDTYLYLRIALDLRPDLPPAQLMLASLYEQVGDYTQAIKIYDSIAPNTVFARRAQVRKALNLEAMGDRSHAMELLDNLAKRYPQDATPVITKADMLREAKEFKGAIQAYTEAMARSEPLKADDWPLFYARGISYERSNNWPNAEADFIKALNLQPNQPDVLNYLAYSWITMNKNMSKAREYLEIASAARPDDPHIIDSAGWAAYLGGDFKVAVDKLERAAQMMPDDVTVNDHLGDAYWRVGRQTEAHFQWERALTFKPDKDTEQALRDKLSKGLGTFVVLGDEGKTAEQLKDKDSAPAKSQVH